MAALLGPAAAPASCHSQRRHHPAPSPSRSTPQVNTLANQLAASLAARGIGRAVPVALLIERSADYIVAVLAVLKAGGCFLPLDPSYPLGRLQAYVEDAKPTVLVAQERFAPLGATLAPLAPQCSLLTLEQAWAAGRAAPSAAANPPRVAGPDDPILVLFTSGAACLG